MEGRIILIYKLNERQMEAVFNKDVVVRYGTSEYLIFDRLTDKQLACIPRENVIYLGLSSLWRDATHYAE